MVTKILLFAVFIFGFFSALTDSEVFTALAHMKELISLEQSLTKKFVEYLEKNPETPDKFHRFFNEVQDQTAGIQNDVETFLGHPMNAFLLIRRFRGGWTDLGTYLTKHDANSKLSLLIEDTVNSSVSKDDVLGCVRAIMRIQDVYQISARDIANGNLSPKTKSPQLNAEHCYEIGFAFYQWENHKAAYDWFIEALERLEDPEYKGPLKRFQVLEFLAWTEYMTDRVVEALNHTIEILKLDKDNDFAKRNIDFISTEVQRSLDKGGPIVRQDPFFKKPGKKKEQFMKIYERLCRGVSKKPKYELLKLKCYYERKRHPLLVIRPLKVEELNYDPYIVMLRDVLYDGEIEYIKRKAAPMLNRATVTNPTSGDLEYADYRVSKSGWLEDHLHDNEDNILKRVNRRTSIITGLDTRRTSAEALQIVNYGTAGHYEPHYDHALESYSAIMRLGMGNRIATVLYYMTDVEVGGSTVFVDAEAIARPSKGDAAFWFNLMRSGVGDPLTRHAGCPVVVGSKWVCNKWIHEHGQEFRRPCSLSIDE